MNLQPWRILLILAIAIIGAAMLIATADPAGGNSTLADAEAAPTIKVGYDCASHEVWLDVWSNRDETEQIKLEDRLHWVPARGHIAIYLFADHEVEPNTWAVGSLSGHISGPLHIDLAGVDTNYQGDLIVPCGNTTLPAAPTTTAAAATCEAAK